MRAKVAKMIVDMYDIGTNGYMMPFMRVNHDVSTKRMVDTREVK